MRLDLTLIQLNALKTMLSDQFDEDERGWLDLIEGETDAFELVRKLLDGIEADEGTAAALERQIEDRKARKERCGFRIEARRDAVMAIMECAKLEKLPMPEATLTLRKLPAFVKVNHVGAVPDEYMIPSPKPDTKKIKEAFDPAAPDLPNWLSVQPERPSLTIRRK